jgi:hypothetical protein
MYLLKCCRGKIFSSLRVLFPSRSISLAWPPPFNCKKVLVVAAPLSLLPRSHASQLNYAGMPRDVLNLRDYIKTHFVKEGGLTLRPSENCLCCREIEKTTRIPAAEDNFSRRWKICSRRYCLSSVISLLPIWQRHILDSPSVPYLPYLPTSGHPLVSALICRDCEV